jgi:hypothetical protein
MVNNCVEPDNVAYNSLIHGYSSLGHYNVILDGLFLAGQIVPEITYNEYEI